MKCYYLYPKKITFKRSEGICCLSCLDVFDLVKSVPFCILLAVPCANRVSLMLRRLKHHPAVHVKKGGFVTQCHLQPRFLYKNPGHDMKQIF